MAEKKARQGVKPEDALYCEECEVPVPKKLAVMTGGYVIGDSKEEPTCPKCKGPLVPFLDK